MKVKLAEVEVSKPPIISAHVQKIEETLLTTVSDKLPVYYVIMGCGTAAVVNHTTLRQTEWGKKQIDGLPIMHIGFKDPWSEYFEHGMGQPPYLLTMPGYHQRPLQATDVFKLNPGCSSKKFAACTQKEWELLWAKYHTENKTTSKFEYLKGWVAFIQKKGSLMPKNVTDVIAKLKTDEDLDLDVTPIKEELAKEFKTDEADYRLVVIVPKKEEDDECSVQFVYAKKIDICTGAGRAQIRFGAGFKNSDANKLGKTKLFIPPDLWSDATKKRRIVTGPEALMVATIWNKSTDRVYVNGGGGIGLNMVERGEGEECYIDWAARLLHGSFNLPRNDTVLRHPSQNPCNVNRATKKALEHYLGRKFNNAPEISVLVVPWLKSKQFASKEKLKSELLFKRSEVIAGRGRGADLFGQIANSDEIMDALDPSKDYLEGARMKAGESKVRQGPMLAATKTDEILTPSDNKWRFGKGCDLDIVKIEDMVTIKVKGAVDRTNKQAQPETPIIRDYYEQTTECSAVGALKLSDDYKYTWKNIAQLNETEGGLYNRVCVTTGVAADDLGEPLWTAKDFTFDQITEDGRTVGLQSDGGKIRVLGAAAQVYPKGFVLDAKETKDPTSFYFNGLPMSAVPPGFIFTGINIASANHYFDDYMNANCNVNTMTVAELKKWILEEHFALSEEDNTGSIAETLAAAVIKHRKLNNGYENAAAIKQALQKEKSLENIPGWEAIIDILQTNYPAARDFLD